MKKFCFFMSAVLMALVFVLAGCEQQADGDVVVEPKEVSENDMPEFSGSVSSEEKGIIVKGAARQFTADTDATVTWTVTGGSDDGGTSISEEGLLLVGKNEAAITLIVRAESGGEELGSAKVKVKGWKDIKGSLAKIISDGHPGSVGGAKYAGITAAAYGNGTWVVAGYSAANWYYGAVAWSKDEGKTWAKAAVSLGYNESINTIIYDGPEGGKQFIIGGEQNNTSGDIHRSTDGVNWTRVSKVMPTVASGVGARHPVARLVYGEVEGGGIYVATDGTNTFAYSSDGVNWTNSDGEGNKLEGIKGKIVHVMNKIAYGSGLINGERVPMFRAWGLDTDAANQRADVYSTTGTSWTPLTSQEAADMHFIPVCPESYAYNGKCLRTLDITKGDMFTGVIWSADGDKIFTGISPGANKRYSPCPDDESVYVFDETIPSTPAYKYNNYVLFTVSGGGKYLAAGVGNRAALAHAEAFE